MLYKYFMEVGDELRNEKYRLGIYNGKWWKKEQACNFNLSNLFEQFFLLVLFYRSRDTRRWKTNEILTYFAHFRFTEQASNLDKANLDLQLSLHDVFTYALRDAMHNIVKLKGPYFSFERQDVFPSVMRKHTSKIFRAIVKLLYGDQHMKYMNKTHKAVKEIEVLAKRLAREYKAMDVFNILGFNPNKLKKQKGGGGRCQNTRLLNYFKKRYVCHLPAEIQYGGSENQVQLPNDF